MQIPMSVIDHRHPDSPPPASQSPQLSAARDPASELADFAPANLPKEQLIVLRAIAGGKSVAAAAQEAGINRCTVYRWQRDPQFQQWLGVWQFQTRDSGRNILLTLIERAARIIEHALEKDDVRVAITLLSKLGVLASGEIPGLGAIEEPALSSAEGPVLSAVEGPVLSAVEGSDARKVEASSMSTADRAAPGRIERSAFAPPKPPKNLNELRHMINEFETKFGDRLPGGNSIKGSNLTKGSGDL